MGSTDVVPQVEFQIFKCGPTFRKLEFQEFKMLEVTFQEVGIHRSNYQSRVQIPRGHDLCQRLSRPTILVKNTFKQTCPKSTFMNFTFYHPLNRTTLIR